MAEETSRPRPLREAAIALGLLAAATLANLVLDPHASLAGAAMVYVLAVVVASYTVSRTGAVFTAIAAVFALNFFFIAPRYTLQVDAQENVLALTAMLGVALVISHLAAVSRRQTRVARLNEARARELQALAGELAASGAPGEVQVLARAALSVAFQAPCEVALVDADGALALAPAQERWRDGLLACIREAAPLGPGTGRWPGLNAWYLPLRSDGHVGGAACVSDRFAQDDGGLEHAKAICALAAQALRRIALAASIHAVEERSQWHKAQNTFLAAISHDFRTPLASIMAAASSLQDQRDKLAAEGQHRLTSTILAECSHLVGITENTLQLVRLEHAGALHLDWQSAEEIVGAVLARVRSRDAGRRIRSHVPPGLPLLRADPVLLAQLIENLLDNALKHTPGVIDLDVDADGTGMRVRVSDRGAGLGANSLEAEPLRRGDGTGRRGTGLGLAVCRAIAQAHGGQLSVFPREGGGSTFCVCLPVVESPLLVETP